MKTAFGPFVFDRAHQLLAREGQEVPLPPRVIGVLDVLSARPGQIVSKQELIETVWKDAFVSDTSLAEAISFLRQALGDDPQQPSYIQTVHRRGYRFLPAAADGAAARVEAPSTTAAAPRDAWPVVLPWAIAVLCGAIAASALWRVTHPDTPAVLPMARFDVALPGGAELDTMSPSVAVSADGSRLVFSARVADGSRVFTRAMDEAVARPLPGTEGGVSPFVSPSGARVGFFADGKLKTIEVGRGGVASIAEARQPMGAVWTDEESILFAARAPGGATGVLQLASGAGSVRTIADVDSRSGELALAWPDLLPGRVVLATAILAPGAPQLSRIVAISLDSGQRTVVLERASFARFVPPNTLVFVRRGDLMAAAFDTSQLTVSGPAVVVLPRVGDDAAQFAVSRVGSIVAAADAEPLPTLAWVTRDGIIDPLPAPLQRLTSASLSADGRRIAAVTEDEGSADVWSTDIERGSLSRLTFDGNGRTPVWAGGNRSVVFAARASRVFNLFVRPLDAAAPRRLTTAAHHQSPASVSPDGRLVAYVDFDPVTGADIWTMPVDGGTATAVVRTPFDETAPAFSSDGRWIAYQSDESNRWEIYVRPFGHEGGAVVISAGGGTAPVWSADGRRVYYAGPTGVMAVEIGAANCGHEQPCELSPSRPVEVVRGPWMPRGNGADGRLLVERARGRIAPASRLNVTLQWTRELQRIVPPAVVSTPK